MKLTTAAAVCTLHGNVSAGSKTHSPATVANLAEASEVVYSNQLPPTDTIRPDNSVENLTPSHFYSNNMPGSKTDRQ